MNDVGIVALAETLIIVMRVAAMRELKTNSEWEQPTLQMVLKIRRKQFAVSVASKRDQPIKGRKVASEVDHGTSQVI